MSLDSVLPARPGQVCPCGAPAVYGLLWRQPPGSRPALRHALACARCAPPEAANWVPPVVALDPLPPSAGSTRPSPVDLLSSPGEGQASERSAAPVEAQAAPPAVAVAGSEEAGRGLPALEPLAAAGGQPTSTPDPWDGPEGRTHSEPQEAPVARAATLPPVDPVAPPGRCRLLGCATSSNVRGLCLPHYDLARRKGQLDELALPPIPRGRGARFQRPAESAPSTRPQGAPRARRVEATEIREIDPQERDRYAAAEVRIASLTAEAARLRARVEELEISRAAALREPEDAYRVSEFRRALAEIVDRDLDGQTDADLIAAATSEIQRLREGWRWAAEDARQTAQALDRARAAPVVLTVEELKARAGWLQEAEKLRGWLVGDIAVSVCADGDWRDIGGDWLFTAVTAAIAARADELERRALAGEAV